jgi:23S rRNA (adenine2503-C2)-methyltransferase
MNETLTPLLFTDLLPDEPFLPLSREPSFRQRQIFKALYSGAMSYRDISTLPQALRLRLQEDAPLISSEVITILNNEESAKLALKLHDSSVVETVLLRDKTGRQTACLSSQVGCAMACAFCKTGTLGLGRSLTAGEIAEQLLHLRHLFGAIDNIVYMGMGEPLHNLKAVLHSVRLFTASEGLKMSSRRFTISTCGLYKEIYKLADAFPQIRLAFSLVTADENLRKKLMPTALTNSLYNLKEALSYYNSKGGRRITLEVALLKNINDRPADAEAIARFADGLEVMINLIPWNKVDNLPFESPSFKEAEKFAGLLRKYNLSVELRHKKGSEVEAACGQLGSLAKKPKVQ